MLWTCLTDLPAKSQGIAVALSLSGTHREVATSLDVSVLGADTGLNSLLQELDKHFKKESVDLSYEQFCDFETFRREKDGNMTKYVVEFERRHQKLKVHGMELPDGIRGCKLLEMANLDPREKQLVLSACTKLEYAQIQSALKRIFSL